MEPIAKRLNQSAEAALVRVKAKKKTATEDVADQIKRLEAELQQSGDSSEEDDSDDDNDDSSSSDDDDNNDKKSGSSNSKSAVLSLSAYANDRVDALPEHLLPKASATAANLSDKKRKRTAAEAEEPRNTNTNTNNGSLLDVMQWPKKVPFACKPCGFVGKDMDDFQAHRASEAHAARHENVGAVLTCKLCDKNFTSPQQLEDHKVGKWHLQRAQQRKERHVVKVCYDFMRGSCKWGDRCQFDHTETKAMKSGKAFDKTKKRACDSFQRTGRCKYGERCMFSHGGG